RGIQMNLINLFQKAIVDIGMKTVEASVFYEAPIGIRFEIGGEEDVYIKKGISRKLYPNPDYVNKAVERASKIFNVLPKKDWILRIDLYDYQEIKKILKALKLAAPHEKVLKEYEQNDENVTHYELYWSLNDIKWSAETITREIILADIGGLDVVAQDKRMLHPLYETFNDWILDYDRETIDHIFKNEHDTFELSNLLAILNKLEEKNIYYQLNKIRDEAIMVEVVVPGKRWEVEFLDDGTVDVEKFISDKDFYDESDLDLLFKI